MRKTERTWVFSKIVYLLSTGFEMIYWLEINIYRCTVSGE
jgi:hypothetical protein